MGDTCLVCQAVTAADPDDLPNLVRWQERQIDRLLRRIERAESGTTPPPNRKSTA